MTCLFSGFTKGCFPSSNRISIRQESKAAPDKTETVKDKPVFCIYDSDESDTERPSPNISSAIYPSSSTSFSSSTDSVNYTTLRSTNQSLKGRSRKSIQPRIPLSNSTDTSTDSNLEITHVPYVRQSCYPSLHRSTFISSSRGIEAHGRDMGAGESKTSFRQAVNLLDENKDLWEQLDWEKITSIQDVFAFLPGAEIRRIREENPSKLAQLCCKLVEKLTVAVETSCRTKSDTTTVINSCRILTRLIPYIFECPEWNSFFWSSDGGEKSKENENHPLAYKLIMALSDLLFCPEFTVSGSNSMSRDEVDDLDSLDSCEYIWEKGVGFAQSQQQIPQHHHNRSELLCLLLTCFSQTMYLTPHGDINMSGDRWVTLFTSPQNRHALPLFTSLLNTVCGYIPGGVLPYNHLIWSDSKEKLVELALQVLIVCLDLAPRSSEDTIYSDNLFLNYLSRLHRDEDFQYILQGITRLLMNPLQQTYLPYAHRKVYFHQELLIFFWKFCENNKKFLFYVLKSSDVLEILVPILHYLNDARADQSRVGLMHIGVFILLLLSGERNFGVRLNKPYTASVPMDIPVFSGSHADLLIIVFHKIITSGHQRLQPLFDCLLTVLCNVSPYIKTLSMVAACKIMHLVEAFSTPWFLLSTPTNHTLIYFLLEMLNNLIQYQFDGNSNLVYTIIRKRAVFHNLAHLPSDGGAISKAMKRKVKKPIQRKSSQNDESMEGSIPALPAEPGTLKASLIKFPGVESFTEAASAHPSQKQLEFLTQTVEALSVRKVSDPVMYPAQPLCPTSSHLVEDGGVHTVQALGGSGGSSLMDTKVVVSTGGSGGSSIMDTKVVENLMDEDLGQRIESTASVQPKRKNSDKKRSGSTTSQPEDWAPTQEWINEWRKKLPLHTVMRLLQVLVPQVEKMCMDKGLTDESEILRFLQHGTLVGLLPVPHPILIRRYQANPGTAMWFRTYMWGVIYLRNIDPAVWFDTHIKLFQVQRI